MRKMLVLAALAAAGLPTAAHAAKPNLKATKVSAPPATLTPGATFRVADSVRNAGRGRAARSIVRYYLTTDAARSLRERAQSKTNPRSSATDILLEGSRDVPALRRGQSSTLKPGQEILVKAPLGLAAGAYTLLACADDRGTVAETSEIDNCVASRVNVAGGADGGQMTTFADWLPDETDAQAAEQLAESKSLACMPVPASKPMNLRSALASIDRYLKAHASEGLRQFAASPDYKNANRAEAAAARALIGGLPGAALAAEVRAHRLEPKEASHLVNAAGVATSVGLAREALALLDASARLKDKVPGAWGFDRKATLQANRAQALAALGRYDEAGKAADAAAALEPTLTEATTTGAMAALCRNDMAKAVKLRKQRRNPAFPVDESLGVEQPLRKLDLPATPRQAESYRDYYEGLQQKFLANTSERVNRESALEAKLRAQKVDPLSDRQATRLMSAFYTAQDTPKLKAQWAQVTKLLDDVQDYRLRFFCRAADCEPENSYYTQYFEEAQQVCEGDPRTDCFTIEINARCRPALRPYHQGWLSKMSAAWNAMDAYNRALSKRMSAFAANIADPDRHALAMLQIEAMEENHLAALVQEGGFWTHDIAIRADHCVDPADETGADGTDPGATAPSGPYCTSKVKALKTTFKLGPATIKFDCEKVSVEGATSGWIAGFGQVAYDFRAGRITVFGGAKASVSVPGGVKAGFKSGIYVTVDNQGLYDAGWRVGPSVSVGAGPVEFSAKDEQDISFIGIFSGGSR